VKFVPIFYAKKLQSQNVTREKICKAILYKKFAQKNVDEIDFELNFLTKVQNRPGRVLT
jgi:hypothetical protein